MSSIVCRKSEMQEINMSLAEPITERTVVCRSGGTDKRVDWHAG